MAKKGFGCEREECCASTGICGSATFGTGKLSDNGYWEYPCEICKQAWDAMKKVKWIPKVEYTSREDMEEFCPEDVNGDSAKYNEVEIAVVREDNKIGLESAGWDNENKITLFSCDTEMTASNDKEADEIFNWWKSVAKTIADALNKKNL